MSTERLPLDPIDALTPEAERFGISFDRLSPGDQHTIGRVIDLLSNPRTRTWIESAVLAARNLDEVRETIPGTRLTQ